MTSAFAPTSMPRVGSSTISTFGSREPSGDDDLLLVAAAEIDDALLNPTAISTPRMRRNSCTARRPARSLTNSNEQ